jgi:hypothetical protein
MTAFPNANYLSSAARTKAEMKAAMEAQLAATKELLGAAGAPTATIASGAITATSGVHAVATEGGASTDDLTTINIGAMTVGRLLLLFPPAGTANVVTLKHGGGSPSIYLRDGQDYKLWDGRWILLMLRSTLDQWFEVARGSCNAGGRVVLTGSGKFTVPKGIDKLWITAMGGGGGGGGGGGSGTGAGNGSNGSAGGNTTWNGAVVSYGGIGGGYGYGNGRGGSRFVGGAGVAEWGENGQHRFGTVYPGQGGRGQVGMAGYGDGGRGGAGAGDGIVDAGGGGGGGKSGYDISALSIDRPYEVSVTPGQVIAYSVGSGGAGGAGGAAGTGGQAGETGEAGRDGILIVEW